MLVCPPPQTPITWVEAFQAATDVPGLERCLELSPENATTAYHLAAQHARDGRAAEALEWIERAVEWGYADDAVLEWDESFRALRAEPRFVAAVARAAAIPAPATGAVVRWSLPRAHDALVTPDGSRAVVFGHGETVLWDPVQGELVAVLEPQVARLAAGIDPEGRRLIVLGCAPGNGHRMQSWDLASGRLAWDVELPEEWQIPTSFERHDEPRLRFTRDGSHCQLDPGWAGMWSLHLVALGDGSFSEVESLARIEWFEEEVGRRQEMLLESVHRTAVSSPLPLDGTRVAFLAGEELHILDHGRAERVSSHRVGFGPWQELESCGTLVLVHGQGWIALFDPRRPEHTWTPDGKLAWPSPDGSLLAVSDGTRTRVYDVEEQAVVRDLAGAGGAGVAAWHASGELLATAEGARVRVWDLRTGEPLPCRIEHPDRVYSLDFSADGRRLVSGSWVSFQDSPSPLLRAWDIASGDEIAAVERTGQHELAHVVQIVDHVKGGSLLLSVLGGVPDLEARDPETLGLRWGYYGFYGGPDWLRLTVTDSGRVFAGSEYGLSCVLEVEGGTPIRTYSDLVGLVPSPDESRAFAVRDGALVVIDGRSLEPLYSFLGVPGGGRIVFTAGLYFAGDPGTWEGTWIVEDGLATPLSRWVEVLYDPVRVAAAAAGARVRPARRER